MSLLFIASPLFAAENDELCQSDVIKSAFIDYLKGIDQPKVKLIQEQLNSGSYGPVDVDGVLGESTRLALQRVCMEFSISGIDNFASNIVHMLDVNSSLIQKTPQWRKIVAGGAFKAWRSAKTIDQQQEIEKTLSVGTADSIQAILDNFAADSTVPSNVLMPSVAEYSPITLDSLPGDTPAVYYQLQGEKSIDDFKDFDLSNELTKAAIEGAIKRLNRMQGVVFPNRFIFMKAVDHQFSGSDIDYAPYMAKFVILARHEADALPMPIQLSGDGCGCSRDFSSVVYGFFPYWLAKQDQVQSVDFSLYDRIGFYALTLGHEGEVVNPLQWGDGWDSSGFIAVAHKHYVDVDLTIYTVGWRDWNDEAINAAVNNVKNNVVHQFVNKVEGVAKIIPGFMKKSPSVQADGVTIYFDDYSSSDSGRGNIIKFMSKLSSKLKESGEEIKLNIMLGVNVDDFEKQSAFKDIKSILLDGEGSQASIGHIFVFLQESTSKAKKSIRKQIEDEFRGAERKAVMRKIVPVISPTGQGNDFSQLNDDLIYFQDNFAGVGFWPLLLPGDAASKTIKDKIVSLYTSAVTSNHFGAFVNNLYPELCKFACPNRWLFRIGFDLLVGILVFYALFAIWFDGLRIIFKKYVLYFAAVMVATAVIAAVSLVCDPFWQSRADLVMALTIVGGIAYVLWRYIEKTTQPPLP